MSFSLQTRILEVGVCTIVGSANLLEYSQRSSVLLSIPRAFATWSVEYSLITCITIGVFAASRQAISTPCENWWHFWWHLVSVLAAAVCVSVQRWLMFHPMQEALIPLALFISLLLA